MLGFILIPKNTWFAFSQKIKYIFIMSSIYLARVTSVAVTAENHLHIRVAAATSGIGWDMEYLADPPQTLPVTHFGSATLSRPDVGQLCLVYKEPSLPKAQILSYLTEPGDQLGGRVKQPLLTAGSLKFQAQGLYSASLLLDRDGATKITAGLENWLHQDAILKLTRLNSRRFQHTLAAGLVNWSETRYLLAAYNSPDFTLNQDLFEDVSQLPDNYAQALDQGQPYLYRDKAYILAGLLEEGHVLQLSGAQSLEKNQAKSLTFQEKIGYRPQAKSYVFKELVVNHKSKQQAITWQEQVGAEQLYQFALTWKSAQQLTVDQPVKITQEILQEPQLLAEQLTKDRYVWMHRTAVNTKSEISATGELFQLLYLSSQDKENLIQFGQDLVMLQAESGTQVKLQEQELSLSLAGGQQFIKITPNTITLQANRRLKLELSLDQGLKINNTAVVLEPFLDALLKNSTTFAVGVNPGAPSPINPKLRAELTKGKYMPLIVNLDQNQSTKKIISSQ